MKSAPDIDVLVVGAGVIGLAIARELANAGRDVLVVEAESAPGTGVSSRSSEVIHAGVYYPAGTLKAKLCVEGRKALYEYCAQRGVPHAQSGKLIVAAQERTSTLKRIAERALANGVELQLLSRGEARALEPELECEAALYSRHSGIVSSHDLMLALLGDAQAAGCSFAFSAAVARGIATSSGVEVAFAGEADFRLKARQVVICAGLSSPRVARSIAGLNPLSIPTPYFAKGSYFSLARRSPFKRQIYPVPEPGGLGVHLTLDLAGRARFGPDVEWLDIGHEDMIDYTVSPERGARFYAAIRRYWPNLRDGDLAPDYSGVRPKIAPAGAPDADFAIHDASIHGARGVVALYGIESPGLTSALAIATHVANMLNLENGG
jgi:L-2-hydroxyglutarate oxidase LhgO